MSATVRHSRTVPCDSRSICSSSPWRRLCFAPPSARRQAAPRRRRCPVAQGRRRSGPSPHRSTGRRSRTARRQILPDAPWEDRGGPSLRRAGTPPPRRCRRAGKAATERHCGRRRTARAQAISSVLLRCWKLMHLRSPTLPEPDDGINNRSRIVEACVASRCHPCISRRSAVSTPLRRKARPARPVRRGL
jgi:hypothetical protein